jgi:hypothetical protein
MQVSAGKHGNQQVLLLSAAAVLHGNSEQLAPAQESSCGSQFRFSCTCMVLLYVFPSVLTNLCMLLQTRLGGSWSQPFARYTTRMLAGLALRSCIGAARLLQTAAATAVFKKWNC